MSVSPDPVDARVDVRIDARSNDSGRTDDGDRTPKDAAREFGDGPVEASSDDVSRGDSREIDVSRDATGESSPGAPDVDARAAPDDGPADAADEGGDDAASEAADADATADTAVDAAADAAGDGEAGEALFDNPSCRGATPNCGSSGHQDCCHRATVSGGPFLRSYDGVGFTDARYGADVSTFELDTFEVTVGRFRTFVQAGFGTQAKPPAAGSGAVNGTPNSGWSAGDNSNLEANGAALAAGLKCSAPYQTWTDVPSSNESRPINCVTWLEAFAFCVWDGARLPTEAEWNYAAAGGSDQRVYPWSEPASATTISDTNASYWVDPTKQCYGDGASGCALSDLVTVGTKPAGRGRWGHADLGGNVWEWTRDTFDNPYSSTTCSNCVDVSKGEMKVIRGGSFYGTTSTLLASGRSQATATTRYYTVGIRCAR
jgi:formylglycine-generating enzyme required for sulfatase activity